PSSPPPSSPPSIVPNTEWRVGARVVVAGEVSEFDVVRRRQLADELSSLIAVLPSQILVDAGAGSAVLTFTIGAANQSHGHQIRDFLGRLLQPSDSPILGLDVLSIVELTVWSVTQGPATPPSTPPSPTPPMPPWQPVVASGSHLSASSAQNSPEFNTWLLAIMTSALVILLLALAFCLLQARRNHRKSIPASKSGRLVLSTRQRSGSLRALACRKGEDLETQLTPTDTLVLPSWCAGEGSSTRSSCHQDSPLSERSIADAQDVEAGVKPSNESRDFRHVGAELSSVRASFPCAVVAAVDGVIDDLNVPELTSCEEMIDGEGQGVDSVRVQERMRRIRAVRVQERMRRVRAARSYQAQLTAEGVDHSGYASDSSTMSVSDRLQRIRSSSFTYSARVTADSAGGTRRMSCPDAGATGADFDQITNAVHEAIMGVPPSMTLRQRALSSQSLRSAVTGRIDRARSDRCSRQAATGIEESPQVVRERAMVGMRATELGVDASFQITHLANLKAQNKWVTTSMKDILARTRLESTEVDASHSCSHQERIAPNIAQ
ncbi:MAG: hypothetical protein SGPRY_007950, partial [Prymnesium sp.]